MKRLTRIGWACASLALLAPAAARADSVSVMTSVYEASFLQLPGEPENANVDHSFFSWCRRCAAPDASPNLVSTNLSALPHDGGMTVGFNGGFTAVFGGMITFPVPAVSSTTTVGASGTSPSITLPSRHEDDPAEHDHGDHGPQHDQIGDKVQHKIDHATGGVRPTGRAALSKAEKLAATPEPATLFLLGTGLVGIAGRQARQAWKRRG